MAGSLSLRLGLVLGRFAPLRSASLRSKLPYAAILRASYRVFSKWLAISPLSRSPQVCTIWSRD